MDDKNSVADHQDEQQPAAPTNRKTDNTMPTVYPDVDFVNRTLP